MDARPSDAINLAVRCGAPIFVAADVARSHGVRATQPLGAQQEAQLPATPTKRLDKTIELRVRLAIAVQEGRLDDAARLRDDIALLLASDANTVQAVTAASLMLEVETAVKEERYRDAAQAKHHLEQLDTVINPVKGLDKVE